MAIGIEGPNQTLVKYSNPCLLGYLFPTLYPVGRGYFSLDYDGIQEDMDQGIIYYEDTNDGEVSEVSSHDDGTGYVSWSDSDGEEEGHEYADENEEDQVEEGDENLSESESEGKESTVKLKYKVI
ncbi:hypothetical protein BGZ75_009419 [Mortierella antarctica]|nr:hypothetical protein BGZ75_009419 [Mortierella antarctica]